MVLGQSCVLEWVKDFAPALKKIRPADLLQFDVGLPYTPWDEFCGSVHKPRVYIINADIADILRSKKLSSLFLIAFLEVCLQCDQFNSAYKLAYTYHAQAS